MRCVGTSRRGVLQVWGLCTVCSSPSFGSLVTRPVESDRVVDLLVIYVVASPCGRQGAILVRNMAVPDRSLLTHILPHLE